MRRFAVRVLFLAAALAACSTPALAQSPAEDDPYARAPEALPPRAIEQGGHAMHRMLDALMGVNVGGTEEAVNPSRGARHRDETLGDVASRDDPYFEERAHRSVDVMTAQLGDMSERLARATPAIRQSLHELKRSMKDALRDLPSDDGY